jgi:hypothetical protein
LSTKARIDSDGFLPPVRVSNSAVTRVRAR